MLQKLLKRTAEELNKQNIPYMIIGGQAVLIYGEPRLTKDIDIALGISVEELQKIKRLVETLRLNPLVEDIDEFVKKTMVFPVLDNKSGIRIDFIFSFSIYESQAIKRAKEIKLGKTGVRFASLEDVVIHKVISGKPRDIEDVKSVLLKNPDYDNHYKKKWLEEFDRSLNENHLEIFKKIILNSQ